MRPVTLFVEPAGHSPGRSWEVIDDPDAVRAVSDRLRRAERFDAFRRPDLYDLAYPGYPGDTPYYLEQGRSGAVLYLGVGTGRIFASLADINPEAIGLEASGGMIDHLFRTHPALRGRVLHADAASAELGAGRFDAVLAPYSFLQCLDDEQTARRAVRSAHRWLRPGGVFLTDTFSPYLIPFSSRGLEASVRACGGARVAIYVRYDHLAQRMTEAALIERPGAPDCVLGMDLRYYFPGQVHAVLADAGFEPPRVHGGYAGEGFDPGRNEVLVYEALKSA